jgi:VanZ family protein
VSLARRRRSAVTPLAWAYAGLIAYASLFPFVGWRWPGASLDAFWWAPWSRYWTVFDVVSNSLGYVPLGALIFLAWVRSGGRVLGAVGVGWLLCSALSALLETLQNFLPQRVPSNLDWCLNTGGAALGLALAWGLHRMGWLVRWQVVREQWLRPGHSLGWTLLLLWPLALLFPLPIPLGTGQLMGHVIDGLRLLAQGSQLLGAVPQGVWDAIHRLEAVSASGIVLGAWGEPFIVALGIAAPCFLVSLHIRTPGLRTLAVAAVGVAGVGVTTLSTALNFGPQHAWAWAAPELFAGLAAGLLVSMLCVWRSARTLAWLCALVLFAQVVLVHFAPIDPYFAINLQAWESGRFIRFHGVAQWVGWLWPYAALSYAWASAVDARQT